MFSLVSQEFFMSCIKRCPHTCYRIDNPSGMPRLQICDNPRDAVFQAAGMKDPARWLWFQRWWCMGWWCMEQKW